MRKLIVYVSVFCMTFLVTGFTSLQSVNEQNIASISNTISPLRIGAAQLVSVKASLVYDMLCLSEKGLTKEAFEYAYRGYQLLLEKNIISRPDYLTICDLSQSSRRKRLYIIDLVNNKIVLNTYVAHGRRSGGEYASKFSNRPESLQSSLGFFVTKGTYTGEHGLSLRMEGLEPGINDRAYRRAIVIHGATYIGEGSAGRSFGCPAVPKKESKIIINTIKNGTCLFIYHPQKNYLRGSKLLNG